MTIDETFRATEHVIDKMQLDVLRVLQAGTMKGTDAQRLLQALDRVLAEVREMRDAAAVFPEQYRKYAASGQSSNEPSHN